MLPTSCLFSRFFLAAHVENYEADLDNEEMHGEYLVGLVTEETIDKKTASCILIARPGTKPEDVKHLKAKISGTTNAITITGPAKSSGFVEHQEKWLAVIASIEKKMHATKLKKRLMAICTKLKKKGKPGSKGKIKTTNISFSSSGISLSNKYFNPGAGEGEDLNLLPIPYTYETDVAGEDNRITEVLCVWRAYIEGSEESVEDEDEDGEEPTTDYDLMVKMMKGNVI